MQLSWSAKYQINNSIKPFLFLEETYNSNPLEINLETKEKLEKIEKSMKNKKIPNKLISFYKNGYKAGYTFERFTWKQISSLNKDLDLRLIFYNQSLVMLVSAFEVFLGDLFIIASVKNKQLKEKISNRKIKRITYDQIEKYKQRRISLGDIIAETYNFQNLNELVEAYKLLGINFKKEIYGDPKANKSFEKIRKTIEERHKVVHEGYINKKLKYEDIQVLWSAFEDIGSKIYYRLMGHPKI